MRAPRGPWAVLIVGFIGLVWLAQATPSSLASRVEALDHQESPDLNRLAAVGPAYVEYDARNGTTFGVFLCGARHCDFAVRGVGDQRETWQARNVFLVAADDGAGLNQTTLPWSLQVPAGPGPGLTVTKALAPRYETRPVTPWIGGTMLAVAVTALAAAWALAWRSPGLVPAIGLPALAAAACMWLVMPGRDPAFLTLAGLGLSGAMVCGLSAYASRTWRPAKWVTWGAGFFLFGLGVSYLLVPPYFP